MSRVVFVGALLLLLPACSDTATEPGGLSGTVSFTYSGGGGGAFSATGVPPANTSAEPNADFAAGNVDTPRPQTTAVGYHVRGVGRFDAALIGINRVTVGSSQISEDCDITFDSCTGFMFIINGSQANEETFDFVCALSTGTFAITELSPTRIRGTLTGSGECFSSSFAVTAFTVTNGTFDVPRVTDPLL